MPRTAGEKGRAKATHPHRASKRFPPNMRRHCAYSCPASVFSGSGRGPAALRAPLRRDLPPFPVFFGISRCFLYCVRWKNVQTARDGRVDVPARCPEPPGPLRRRRRAAPPRRAAARPRRAAGLRPARPRGAGARAPRRSRPSWCPPPAAPHRAQTRVPVAPRARSPVAQGGWCFRTPAQHQVLTMPPAHTIVWPVLFIASSRRNATCAGAGARRRGGGG